MKAEGANSKLNTFDFTLDLTGKLLSNRYYLCEPIAKKNYSQVYLARDIAKHRKCIVKRLDLNSCPAKIRRVAEEMFWREAKISQKLSGKHPQIGQFYNYFRRDDSCYLVQEWIPGITLEQLQLQQQFSESEIKEILLNLLPVLEYIHAQGIIHHDIKPNNIILRSHDNLPVLIDFGVAREIGDRNLQNSITGTPGYMSLEQAMGQIAYDNDLYNLGSTAVHLLTGSPANNNFQGHQIKDPNLKQIIERAIAPEPKRRFTSAKAMRLALSSTVTTEARPKQGLPLWIVLLFVAIPALFVWMNWNKCGQALCLTTKLEERPPVNAIELFPRGLGIVEDPVAIATPPENSLFDNIIFTVGTTEQEILQALGEPLWRKPGFWENSIAWSYEDIVARGIDIGYMFDVQTNRLKQSEIAVPPTTSLNVLQQALSSLLPENNAAIAQGLREVYQHRRTVYNFSAGDLQGTIQRNHKDRLYLAVWSKGFH